MLNDGAQTSAGRAPRGPEAGATLIEVVIAMAILLIGLLSLVAAMAWALTVNKRLREMTNTKMTITSMLEQIETLRNTRQLTFGQIANQGQVDNTAAPQRFDGFPAGLQPVSANPGPDGIYGTGDDLTDAGPDGAYGTRDDFFNTMLARTGYMREIRITNLSVNLKKIEVTMTYPGRAGDTRTLVGVSYLNNNAKSTYR